MNEYERICCPYCGSPCNYMSEITNIFKCSECKNIFTEDESYIGDGSAMDLIRKSKKQDEIIIPYIKEKPYIYL